MPSNSNQLDHYDDAREVDEWTFTMEVPSAQVRVAGFDDAPSSAHNVESSSSASHHSAVRMIRTSSSSNSSPNKEDKQKERLIFCMTQAQPSAQYSNNNRNKYTSTTTTTTTTTLSEEEIVDAAQERASLLQDEQNESVAKTKGGIRGTTTTTTATKSQLLNKTGWTMSSPFWSIRSQILLRATMRPAWQAIPEYTNAAHSCSTCWRLFCTCCSGTAGQAASSHVTAADHLDFWSETWTTDDVVAVECIQDDVSVLGIGSCRGLRIYLRPLSQETVETALPPVPEHLRGAWDKHVRHMQNEQIDTFQFTPEDVVVFGANDSKRTKEDKEDPYKGCPILFICLPLSQIDPPMLWKVHFPPTSLPLALETLTMFEGTLLQQQQELMPRHSRTTNLRPPPPMPKNQQQQQQHDPTHIFINGYQSWSFSGSLLRGQPQPKPALPNFLSRAFNFGGSPPPPSSSAVVSSSAASRTTKPPPPLSVPMQYQSDFFTCVTSDVGVEPTSSRNPRDHSFPFTNLDERGGPALILGWLSQREQFGVIQSDVNLQQFTMHASAHGQILLPQSKRPVITDWAHAQLLSPHSYDEEPLVHFFHAVAGYNAARPLQNGNLLVGWCSWYHYYENISEDTLRDNFAKLSGLKTKVPMNVSVVDDGYMTAWGDWDSLKPRKFTSLDNVARDIVANKMRPGLWLAPFAADKHSKLTKAHPDWVIRNEIGVVSNSSNCGKFFHGLDATNPEVRQHVHESIRRAVADWNFRVLKIDFLYAACLEGNGKYDLSKSRAQAMHMALDTIRQAAGPDTFLIGCGCPIASAVGFVDGMRVSADTGPTWYPAFPLPWWDHGTLPCLRSMTRNSLTRAPMGHRWWHNDPDCLLLGESTRLTLEEVASAASVVAMTCGMMLLSDDLTKVSVSRMRILTKIFPMAGATAVVLDLHSTNDGMPSLLRLWATDRYSSLMSSLRENHILDMQNNDSVSNLQHVEATFFARQASFQLDLDELPEANERKRSCIHVCQGLGTWTIVSISNWSDKPAVLHVPPPALLPPPTTVFDDDKADTFLDDEIDSSDSKGKFGFHAFAFWSSRYTWLPYNAPHADASAIAQGDPPLLGRRLAAHETEIFHIKPVTPDAPQYVGSDLHFSCGKEVHGFAVRRDESVVEIQLNPAFNRVGHVFLYLPRIQTEHVRVFVNGEPGTWSVVGNTPSVDSNGSPRLVGRIIRIMLVVHADESPQDGKIVVHY